MILIHNIFLYFCKVYTDISSWPKFESIILSSKKDIDYHIFSGQFSSTLKTMHHFESGSFRPDDLFAPGRFAPLICSPRVVSPRKVSRFAPLNCYYIIIDEVFFDNFSIIIYLLASCCGFSYYYRFSDIAISNVNPSFIWLLEFSKNS